MNLSRFTIFPAIHLRNGEVVRFTQGDTENPVVFNTDPVACARQWIDQGAEWLQIVNLKAEEARNGVYRTKSLQAYCEAVPNHRAKGLTCQPHKHR